MDLDGYKIDQHWKKLINGATVISTTPEQLWQQAIEYFKWNDENPIKAKRTLTSGKTQGEKITVEFNRPYTVKAFCLHAGISERWINDIKESHDKSSDWYTVMERILTIIYTQILEGGLVDLYNPIMVSKVLNMDKQDGETDKPPRVEIVDSRQNTLSNSEDEVLKKLDFGKVEIIKEKSENYQR